MNIIYNNLNINDGINYSVDRDHNIETPAKQTSDVKKIARTNDSILLRRNYGIKTITLNITVSDTSIENLDLRLDTLISKINADEKNLDVDYAGGIRRFVCSGQVGNISRPKNIKWAKVSVEFKCYRAFGEEASTTDEIFAGVNTTPYTDDIEILGTAEAQPTITIDINAITKTVGIKFIQLKNIDNGDYVKIEADDFAVSDVIIIDTRSKLITRNGTPIVYLGIMPKWGVGVNNWDYTDDFTTRNVTISFSYKKRYL